MAPIALSDVSATTSDEEVIPEIKDPSILPLDDASERVKKIWNLHGHPHSKRFANPELTTVASLVKHNAQTQPTNVAFLYPNSNANDSFETLTWQQFYDLVRAAVSTYAEILAPQIQSANGSQKQPTIAFLGVGNTIDYLLAQMALNQLNVRILLLSNKNASNAREHLLDVCGAVCIIADEANAAILDAQSEKEKGRTIFHFVSFADLQAKTPDDTKAQGFEVEDVWNLQSMVLHSSGSTGMPKPIIHTNRSLCLMARMYRLFPSFVIDNWYLCFPLFHIAGLCIALSGLPNGLATTMPPRQWPPAPGTILTGFRALRTMGMPADCLHSAPSVIEDLYGYISATTGDFSPLVDLKAVQPGGAPLGDKVLKELVAKGVNIKTTYGSTETGPSFRSIPHTRDNPHCYRLRNMYPESPFVQMEPLADESEGGTPLFECVIYKGYGLAAELWLAPDAPNPYRTNDLFFEDPPGSGSFVLLGRKDDVLVLDNGEKTHGGTLAALLEEEGHGVVIKAAVFGNGRPCVAAIVQLADGGDEKLQQVLERVNEKSATHARIDREMVLVLGAEESLPVTPKGNVRRKEAWRIYGDRVDTLYENYLGAEPAAAEDDDGIPDHLASLSDEEFVKATLAEVCDTDTSAVGDETSFYDLGLDSQKAVKLRSRLVKRFGTFPLMFIFEYPSVKQLLEYLHGLKNSNGEESHESNTNQEQRLTYIQNLIASYNSTIDEWASSRSPSAPGTSDGEVVYLTGASGALGNALLEAFVAQEHVAKVYCAIRGVDPRIKLIHSLKQRGYAESVYCSGKIHAIPYDMKDELLGCGQELFDRLAEEVTVVVHNAWKMDFNQKVEEFEKDCLKGTMSLLKFCQMGAPKTFSVMSSVAACMGDANKGRQVPEEPVPDNPKVALSTGYGQSKYIVERITQHYSTTLSLPVKLFRVGQLCGHSRLGVWNTSEMWPIMMATGLKHLHAMPVLPGAVVNWLPVDMCAAAINRALVAGNGSDQPYAVRNLVNPSTASWTAFLDVLAAAAPGMPFERVEMAEWVRRLESVADAAHAVPGLKLLGYFQDMVRGANGEEVDFETGSVEEGRTITVDMVRGWLERWQASGFL